MKQNDGIAYEKPELLKYSLLGLANGAADLSGGLSNPTDSGDDTITCEDGFITE